MESVDAGRRASNAASIAARIKELQDSPANASEPATGSNILKECRRQSAVFLADITGGLLNESKAMRVVRRLENFLEKRELTMGFTHWKTQVRHLREKVLCKEVREAIAEDEVASASAGHTVLHDGYPRSLRAAETVMHWARIVHSENFERVSDEHLLLAARHVSLKRVAPGEALFLEGDPGAHFMLVLSGSIVIHVGMPESSQALIFADRERHLQQHDLLSSSFLGERVHEFTTGTGFGEVALTEKGEAMRRSASAIGSESGAEVLQIPAGVYEKSLANGFGDRRYKRLNALKSIFLFEGWNRARLISLSQRLIDRTFQYGEALLHAGDEWPGLLFITGGTVRVVAPDRRAERAAEVVARMASATTAT